MSVPAWKQAVIERRKKQEEAERKKQQEEEQYLSSLPPWKRAIILRNREKSGTAGGAPHSPNVTKKTVQSPASKPPISSPKQPIKTTSTTNQWQAAVQISVASSPTRQRPPWARTSSPGSSDSPKRTRSNLWERNKTAANSVVVPARAHSFNVTSENQPVSKTALSLLQNRRGSVIADEETQKAIASSQVKASPLQSKASPYAAKTSTTPQITPAHSNDKAEVVQLRKKDTSSDKKESIAEKRRSFEKEGATSTLERKQSFEKKPSVPAATTNDAALANMPAWKKALILRRRQQQAAQEKPEAPKPNKDKSINPPRQENTQVESVVGVDETDSPAVDTSSTPPSVQETPTKKASGKKTSKSKKSTTTSKTQDSKGTKRVKKTESKSKQPEVVNRAPAEISSGKLVTQEGVTLHPPVYKEVEQWANVAETDDKFLSLPPWKQALIKRRRADIAKRTGPKPPPEEKKLAEPAKPVHTAWSPRSSVDIQNSKPSWKQEALRKRRPTPPPSKAIPEDMMAESTGSSVQSLLGKFSGSQSSAGATPSKKSTQGNQKQHRVFSVGNAASESSDSELEDVVVTCIDDDTSDEDDSGIDKGTAMRSRSAPTSPTPTSPTGTMTRTSSKSILLDPEKKSYRKLRRVSFSDSQLTVEHSYPKYDYRDYDGVNTEGEVEDSDGLAQKIHPSLRRNNDFGRYGSPTGNGLSGWTPTLTGYGDLLLQQLSGNFNSPPTSPTKTSSTPQQSVDTSSDDRGNDFYANLNTDTAALLW